MECSNSPINFISELVKNLSSDLIKSPYMDERSISRSLFNILMKKYTDIYIQQEVSIQNSKYDLLLVYQNKNIIIELKEIKSRSDYDRLVGQISRYSLLNYFVIGIVYEIRDNISKYKGSYILPENSLIFEGQFEFTNDYNQMLKIVMENKEFAKKQGTQFPLKRETIYTLENMQVIADKIGARCISKTFVSVNSDLKWKCKHGHIWENPPKKYLYGGKFYCPDCKKEGK